LKIVGKPRPRSCGCCLFTSPLAGSLSKGLATSPQLLPPLFLFLHLPSLNPDEWRLPRRRRCRQRGGIPPRRRPCPAGPRRAGAPFPAAKKKKSPRTAPPFLFFRPAPPAAMPAVVSRDGVATYGVGGRRSRPHLCATLSSRRRGGARRAKRAAWAGRRGGARGGRREARRRRGLQILARCEAETGRASAWRAPGAGGGDLVRGPARRGRAGWGQYDRWRAEPSSDQGELFVGTALGPSGRGGSGSGFPGSVDGPR
ncbi:unnamed protein product, partial [Urochloa humidicola]